MQASQLASNAAAAAHEMNNGSGEGSSNGGIGMPISGQGGFQAPADSSKPKKRVRRTANEINRRFVCTCGKAYGSEGSLN